MVGLAGEEVAAARAAVREQPAPGEMAPLDLGAVGGRRADHDRGGLLLDPAEGRDVVIRAEQDARLTRACLRRQIRLPLGEPVRALLEPARHRWDAPVAHRQLQDRQREPVDLEEHHPRDACLLTLVRAARYALDDADGIRVVVVGAEHNVEYDGDRRGDQRNAERRPEGADLEVAVGETVGREQDRRVEREHDEKARQGHERQPKRGDERRQDRVQDPDRSRRDQRAAVVVDDSAGNHRRRNEQRQRG